MDHLCLQWLTRIWGRLKSSVQRWWWWWNIVASVFYQSKEGEMQDKRIQRTLFGATFTPIDRQCQLKIIESSDYYSLAHPPTQATAFPLNSPFDIIMFIFRLLNSSSVSLTLVHSLAEKVATWRTCVNNTQRTLAYPLPMAVYGGHRRYNSPLNRYDISRLHWNIYQGTWMWLYNEMRGWNIILLDVLAILIIFTFCWELGI